MHTKIVFSNLGVKSQPYLPKDLTYKYTYKLLEMLNCEGLKLRVYRRDYISSAFLKFPVYVYQGRVWTRLRLTLYHVGLRFGMFAATKKPFLFRPKKKKVKR